MRPSNTQMLTMATPLQAADLNLLVGKVEVVIIDEADKMLNLGLNPQLEKLRKLFTAHDWSEKLQGPVTVPRQKRKKPQVRYMRMSDWHRPGLQPRD